MDESGIAAGRARWQARYDAAVRRDAEAKWKVADEWISDLRSRVRR